MTDFALDENIIILAARLQNKNGAQDSTASTLIHSILDSFHAMACTDELFTIYDNQLQKLMDQGETSAYYISKLLHMAKTDSQKIKIIERIFKIKEIEKHLPNEVDCLVVKIGIQTLGIVVSTDSDILTLRKHGLEEKYRFRVMEPSDALIAARRN